MSLKKQHVNKHQSDHSFDLNSAEAERVTLMATLWYNVIISLWERGQAQIQPLKGAQGTKRTVGSVYQSA